MKRFYPSLFTVALALAGVFCTDASAQHRGAPRIAHMGNTRTIGGNGGPAHAQAGTISSDKKAAPIHNAGNASATGGNGGSAIGNGAKGGNGGGASAKAGDLGLPIKGQPVKTGTANAGNATATGGNGGNANGNGAKGGNGGGAVAVSGNGNTVLNGNNNTNIGKVVNNNISFSLGGLGGGFGSGSGGGSSGSSGYGGGGSGFDNGIVTDSGAFAQAGAGGNGPIQGKAGTAVASTPSETVVTNDGSPAIAQAADGKDNIPDGEVEHVFTRRLLKVKNDSGVAMKVFVQYRSQDDKKWTWVPAAPNESKEALVYELTPGQEMYLQHKGSKLSASRVRIWGVADGQTWFDYRDQDLWVVPEMDQRGEHRYQATDMRTFTFVFPKQDQTAAK